LGEILLETIVTADLMYLPAEIVFCLIVVYKGRMCSHLYLLLNIANILHPKELSRLNFWLTLVFSCRLFDFFADFLQPSHCLPSKEKHTQCQFYNSEVQESCVEPVL
jgi:hypothetical protein